MKKIALVFALFLLMLGAYLNTHAQVIVKVRPVAPVEVEVRPAAPFAGAIWIEPEWRWVHGRYEYVHGHWLRPRRGWRWEPGRWEERPGGVIWIRGGWRR